MILIAQYGTILWMIYALAVFMLLIDARRVQSKCPSIKPLLSASAAQFGVDEGSPELDPIPLNRLDTISSL